MQGAELLSVSVSRPPEGLEAGSPRTDSTGGDGSNNRIQSSYRGSTHNKKTFSGCH